MVQKINILGRKWTVRLFNNEKEWNKVADLEGTNGETHMDAKQLIVYATVIRSDKRPKIARYLWTDIEKVLWHEIGHAVAHIMPTGIKDDEWTASMFEAVPHLVPQVKRIMEEFKKEFGKTKEVKD